MPGNNREIERCRNELNELLKHPENRYCADCGSKQPTWASTNIGVFVCIRCSGIHRNLGTHISKVKSTTLDSWTTLLLEQFKAQGGNQAVNLRYEARLPKQDKPTEFVDTYRLEQFIRMKYAAKKWFEPLKIQKDDKSKRSDQSGSQLKPSPQTSSNTRTPAKPAPKKDVPDLIPSHMLSNNQPEDLLKFESSIENNPIIVNPGNISSGGSDVWRRSNVNVNHNNTNNAASGFSFINVNNGTTHTSNLSNAKNDRFSFIRKEPQQPLQKGSAIQNVDILDEPTANNSKNTILSMYKQQQPLLQPMNTKTSTAFLTQLPPNLDPFAQQQKLQSNNMLSTNVNMMGMGQMGTRTEVGNTTTGFNAPVNSQIASNPYTMLNNQPNHFLF